MRALLIFPWIGHIYGHSTNHKLSLRMPCAVSTIFLITFNLIAVGEGSLLDRQRTRWYFIKSGVSACECSRLRLFFLSCWIQHRPAKKWYFSFFVGRMRWGMMSTRKRQDRGKKKSQRKAVCVGPSKRGTRGKGPGLSLVGLLITRSCILTSQYWFVSAGSGEQQAASYELWLGPADSAGNVAAHPPISSSASSQCQRSPYLLFSIFPSFRCYSLKCNWSAGPGLCGTDDVKFSCRVRMSWCSCVDLFFHSINEGPALKRKGTWTQPRITFEKSKQRTTKCHPKSQTRNRQ